GAGNHFKYFPRDKAGGTPISFMRSLYVEDDKELNPDDFPEDFYSTTVYTDKALEFLQSEQRAGRPFFGSMTYTAPHWPYQAPPEIIAKYRGKYDHGPAVLRRERLKRALELGIIPDGIEPHQVETSRDKAWKDLTDEEKRYESRIMEIYA
ncbi:hypothetical protein WICPIJ_007764, partial [Wickerhamomyces pijperi]